MQICSETLPWKRCRNPPPHYDPRDNGSFIPFKTIIHTAESRRESKKEPEEHHEYDWKTKRKKGRVQKREKLPGLSECRCALTLHYYGEGTVRARRNTFSSYKSSDFGTEFFEKRILEDLERSSLCEKAATTMARSAWLKTPKRCG